MTRTAFIAAAATLLTLAACNSQPTSTAAENAANAAAEAAAAAPPIELPPAVKSTKTYRCDDNSVVTVDLFVGDMMANIHLTEDGPPTRVKAAAAGEPLVAEGFSLVETADGITLAQPGKPSQSCKA